MVRRTRAREVAFQILYEDDHNPAPNPAMGDDFINRRLRPEELRTFARGLVAGVRRHRREIDERLVVAAAHWRVERMAGTDRNVLRLAAFELLHTDTPGPVVINEAVELARRYGTVQSPSFVNGILDRLLADAAADPDQAANRDAGPTLSE